MNSILFFDLFATTYLIFLGFGGFKHGFIIEIGKIIGLIITFMISFLYYIDLAEILHMEFSINPVATLVISFFVIFSLTFIVTRIIIGIIDQVLGFRKTRYFNQLAGFGLAIFKGIIIITFVLWIFELLPYQKWTDTLYENSTIARSVRYARDTTINYFGWDEPINEGKDHIKELFENSVDNLDPAE